MRIFAEELAQYLEDNTSLVVGTNLMIGELLRGVEGVFLTISSGSEPDRYLPTFNETIDFWSIYKDSEDGYNILKTLYFLLHRGEHYNLTSYHVYYSNALGQIADFDRDAEGRKIWKLTVDFTILQLIS